MRKYGLRFGVAVCCFVTALAVVWSWGSLATLKTRLFGASGPTVNKSLRTAPHSGSLDDEVYAAVVRERFLPHQAGLVVLKAETSRTAQNDALESVKGDRAEVAARIAYGFSTEPDEATLDDYLDQNGTRSRLTVADLGTPFVSVSERELHSTGASEDFWTEFYLKYPGSSGLITFSQIGFNEAGDQAFLYVDWACGWLCASGDYLFLKKVDGKWRIAQERNVWVS
jgi:hypothetical protein